MVNVLELFSTDRRLLETRGSLIIRQLCLHLNAERIFRTIAEILEKDDVGLRSMPRLTTGSRIREYDGRQVEYDLDHFSRACGFQETSEES